MRTLVNLAFLLPLALWSGSAFFFTLVAAPLLFQSVPRETFTAVVNTLFPVYFILGVVLLGVSGLTLGLRAWRQRSPVAVLLASLVAVAWLGTLASATLVAPQIGAARALAGTPEGEALFRRAHGLSMSVNAVAMVAVLGAWLLIAHQYGAPRKARAGSRSEPRG